MDPISAGATALTLINGKGKERKAASLQDRALSLQEDQYALIKPGLERAIKLSGEATDRVLKADKDGLYDPDAMIRKMESDDLRVQATRSGNYASSARILGYKPGDSVATDNLNAIDSEHQRYRDNMRTQIRNDAPRRYMADLGNALGLASNSSANSSSATNQMSNTMLQHSGLIGSQVPDPTGLLFSLIDNIRSTPGGNSPVPQQPEPFGAGRGQYGPDAPPSLAKAYGPDVPSQYQFAGNATRDLRPRP